MKERRWHSVKGSLSTSSEGEQMLAVKRNLAISSEGKALLSSLGKYIENYRFKKKNLRNDYTYPQCFSENI